MRSSYVQGFVSTVPTLYEEEEEEEDDAPLYRNKRMLSSIFTLHCIPLYRNTQHYVTLSCSIETRLCAGGT